MKDNKFFTERENIKKILDSTLFKENNFFNNLIENKQNLRCFPIFCNKKFKQINQNNVYFIGDAFFAFPPTFAQGASQSIESAYNLNKLLNENNNENFTRYNKDRAKKTKLINKISRFNYFVFHLSNTIIVFIRNLILKNIVKNKNFLSKYLRKVYFKR